LGLIWQTHFTSSEESMFNFITVSSSSARGKIVVFPL
jgi:hypothetical protein